MFPRFHRHRQCYCDIVTSVLTPQDNLPEVEFLGQTVYVFLKNVPSRKICQCALPLAVSEDAGFPSLYKMPLTKEKNKAAASRMSLLSAAGFLKGHLVSLRHVGIFSHLEDGEFALLIPPPPWDISNVNHLRLWEMRPVDWGNSFPFLGLVLLKDLPQIRCFLPSAKLRGAKRFPVLTARPFHKSLVLILAWQLQ